MKSNRFCLRDFKTNRNWVAVEKQRRMREEIYTQSIYTLFISQAKIRTKPTDKILPDYLQVSATLKASLTQRDTVSKEVEACAKIKYSFRQAIV